MYTLIAYFSNQAHEKMTRSAKANKQLEIQSVAINEVSLIYRAIYHPLRLKIIEQIYKAEKISVSKLNKKLKEDKSLLSQQLKILRDANILSKDRNGKQVLYSININQIEKIQTLSNKIAPIPKSKPIVLSQRDLKAVKERLAKPKKSIFSPNELQVIKLICEQHTNEEIGEKLKLSKRTIEDYRLRIIEKMKMKNTAGLVVYAMRNGIFN